jgi:pyrroloquinoline-quinone synthase
MDVIARLDATRHAINVLEHPFYERWSAGELSAGELARYAGEYRHAVLALADASARAAAKAPAPHADALRRHAQEEAAHVQLWDRFAACVGARAAGDGASDLPQTRACVQAWTAGDQLLEHLAVLYAVEASQPQIAATKLDGLRAHYGYSDEGPATEYFTLHALRDVEHAREAAGLIAQLMDDADDPAELAERMALRAIAALQGNWLLLNGVEGAMRAA